MLTPFELAIRDLAQGRDEEALRRLDALNAETARPASERAAIANKRGVALIHLKRSSEARAAFEDALKVLPAYAPALVNLGNLQLESGDLEAAIGTYRAAVASDDEYALAHHNLGVALKRQGHTAEAVRELRRAHRLEGRVLVTSRGRRS